MTTKVRNYYSIVTIFFREKCTFVANILMQQFLWEPVLEE